MNNIIISPNFKLYEFQCPCCSRVMIHKRLIEAIQVLHDLVGQPLVINSGYRCLNHNRTLWAGILFDCYYYELTDEEIPQVKAHDKSQHVFGKAADVRPEKNSPLSLDELKAHAEKLFDHVELTKKPGAVHCDVRHAA